MIGEMLCNCGDWPVVDDNTAAAARVRGVFKEVVARGFRAEAVEGASDEQIDIWAAAQGVRVVPAAVREIMRIMGKSRIGWLASSIFGLTVDARDKEFAGWCVEEADERGIEHGMQDPAGMLVIAGDGTSASHLVIDGSDLAEPDPPIWLLVETGEVTRSVESVTAWFANTGEELMQRRHELKRRRAVQEYFDRVFRW
jgi:hypothetical protein